jgi:multidrug resistance efflux pump
MRVHWRVTEALHEHGPRVLLLGSVLAVLYLAVQGPRVGIPGYAEVAPVRIASLETAKVLTVEVAPGDVIEAGQIVGTLDDGPLRGRMRVLEAQLERHSATLAQVEQDAGSAVRLALADEAEARSRLQGTRESLEAAERVLADRRRQVESGLAAATDLERLELEVTTLRATERRDVTSLQHRGDAVRHAREQLAGGGDGEAAPALLEEVRSGSVLQEELALLQERHTSLTLRAPLAARVSVVHYRAGEVLPANAVIVELLPLSTTTVYACLPEQYGREVRAGGSAELYPADGGPMRNGTVVDVEGLVSEAPDRCKQRPNEFGWVRPIRVQVDGEGLVPGQRFDLILEDAAPGETP